MVYSGYEKDGSPGILISFEGGEGAGKSTHINFLAETLEAQGYEVLRLREPGGTAIGEKLRDIVLDIGNAEMSDVTELFIYEAARAQIVSEAIKPALERGAVVLCDRFFDSTVAYQVFGRGLARDFVERANRFAAQGVVPDRTIVMSCGRDAHAGLERATKNGFTDRLESAGEAFHDKVNEAFFVIAGEDPGRIRVVESADRKSETSRAVFSALVDIFPWMAGLLADGDFFAKIDVGHYGNKHESAGQPDA
ncbi:MAG: dTMP kinase [Eggerthellaceae bacterium]|nr:dTMP kinase [Eggerthellaceae bacterium]